MDDAIGVVRPHVPALYTLHLKGDGTVAMHLNCNRATGTWRFGPSSDVSNGRFEFGPLAATRALCPPPSMDERVAADARFVRGYLLKDGRLYLSLMADAGIYAWEPETPKSFSAAVPAAPEDGGPRNWEVSGVSRAVNLREQPSTSARIVGSFRPGTVLDNLGCQQAGQPMTQCEFGVARAGGGYATVVVKRSDGRSRAIFFRMGKPIGADASQADGYPEFRATKDSDLNRIRIGAERYEIPDAVVLGG